MLIAKIHSLIYKPGENVIFMPVFVPDRAGFGGENVQVDGRKSKVERGGFLKGFDDWLSHFPREEEIEMVKNTLASLEQNPRRIHIDGISCAESVELIREYYRSRGYEDALAKNYVFSPNELLTVSVNLRHLLWCEKDKEFLRTKDGLGPLYAITPPLRSPHDLRSLQQAARMGIIMGVEVFPGDEIYLPQILGREILTPFQMTQLVGFRWEKYGFIGEERMVQFAV